MTLIGITVRSWLYEGSCALENMVLGMEERAVRDSINQLSTDEFDACLAIIVCRSGANTFAHLGQIVGHYRGDLSRSGTAARMAGQRRVRPTN